MNMVLLWSVMLGALLAAAPSSSAQHTADPQGTVVITADTPAEGAQPIISTPPSTPGPGATVVAAELVDPETLAQQHAVSVRVNVNGVKLVEEVPAGEVAAPEGRLHYRIDDGPVTIQLVGLDHTPLGPEQRLTVTVP